MNLLLDQKSVSSNLPIAATVAEALGWIQSQLPEGKVVTRVELNGQLLEGQSLAQARPSLVGGQTLSVTTADRKELSLSMLGRIAALIEWLSPQHKEVASLLEKGDSAAAFERLGRIFSLWQQVQQAYGSLAKLNGISLAQLPVRDLTGEAVVEEFCRQLGEMQSALQNRDLVMLADILQYEMDGAVKNWMSLLESTLAIVEPATATA